MNNTLKLLFKISIFLIITYATCYIYIKYFAIYYNSDYNNRWYYLNKVINKQIDISDSSVKYLFLGESRVNAGIDFNRINNSWSMAYEGSSPIETYFILKKYLKTYPKPDSIFLSISPRFFCEILCFWDNAVRNEFIDYNDFKEISENSKNLDDTVLGNFIDLKFLLYQIKYIAFYQADIYANRICFAKKTNLQMIDWMQNNKGQRFHPNLLNSSSELNYETKYQNFKPSPLLDSYFDKIFELCRKNNIALIFFAMPMNKSSFAKLNLDFKNQYSFYIEKYSSKYPEFLISDSLYFYEDTYFGDNSHLNPKGKQIFTNELIEKYFK